MINFKNFSHNPIMTMSGVYNGVAERSDWVQRLIALTIERSSLMAAIFHFVARRRDEKFYVASHLQRFIACNGVPLTAGPLTAEYFDRRYFDLQDFSAL